MQKYTLKIDGMSCGMCESHVNDTIRNHFKVKKVKSSASKGETLILAEDLEESAVKAALDPTGYRLLSFHSEPYVKKGLFGGF